MICNAPFTQLGLMPVDVQTCCYREWPVPLDHDNPWATWNHPEIQKVRSFVLTGFNCKGCPRSAGSEQYSDAAKEEYQPLMRVGPKCLTFSVDVRCGLRCRFCKPEGTPMTLSRNQDEILVKTMKRYLVAFKDHVNLLHLSGGGDPFFAPSYLQFLRTLDPTEFPNLQVSFVTNANWLVSHWDSIPVCTEGKVKLVIVSIDAGTQETYEKIRLGGSWTKVIEALDFLKGKVPVRLHVVLTSLNWREIPTIVKLAESYGFSYLLLPVRQFSARHEEVYNQLAIQNPNHPEHNQAEEFLKSLDGVDLTFWESAKQVW